MVVMQSLTKALSSLLGLQELLSAFPINSPVRISGVDDAEHILRLRLHVSAIHGTNHLWGLVKQRMCLRGKGHSMYNACTSAAPVLVGSDKKSLAFVQLHNKAAKGSHVSCLLSIQSSIRTG